MVGQENKKLRAIEARRAYHRQWRAKNRERVKKYNSDYWIRKASQLSSEANVEDTKQEED